MYPFDTVPGRAVYLNAHFVMYLGKYSRALLYFPKYITIVAMVGRSPSGGGGEDEDALSARRATTGCGAAAAAAAGGAVGSAASAAAAASAVMSPWLTIQRMVARVVLGLGGPGWHGAVPLDGADAARQSSTLHV